jgi:uncharacterized protein (TIGR03437 family)
MLNGNPMSTGYAGLQPGQVGLYRIDLTIPTGGAAGDQMLSVSQNGLNSNIVLLTVGQAVLPAAAFRGGVQDAHPSQAR